MSFLNPRKKRFWVLLCAIGMFVLQALLPPVRPFIQLPGEIYPGTEGMPILGGWTNTFSSSILAWIVVIIIVLFAGARNRTADEIPTGFYNVIEMVVEAAYNFASNIAGAKKVKDFFPFFMTYLLIILVSNWMGLLPGFDSIGFKENKAVFELHQIERAEGYVDNPEAVLAEVDKKNKGDLLVGPWLLSAAKFADDEAAVEEHDYVVKLHDESVPFVEKEGYNPEAADWTIVPFFRPAATDLNMTLAFAIIAMVMVQYYGVKYLGAREYFSKFFPFIRSGWGAEVAADKIKAIDPAVGILELISEISKIISFAFRLLGNIFAGMVLLFVMAFLFPAANIAFFGLEFFVGLIQAIVFALLMLIFMVSATESHHGDHDGHDDHH